ncbi:MAG: CaiB/BaiF CoA transferase family protein [Sporichthyaceae bacterium]
MSPLAGLRVVELGGIGPVPFAGMLLADLGAEVTAITRAAPAGGPDPMTAATGGVLGRGRTEVVLDLKGDEGRAAALDLVAAADVVLEGFRPGAIERLGLGPGVLLARNPALVLGRMTGWGQSGPYAQAPGHDLNYLAVSGILAHLGGPDGPPTAPQNLLADFGGGGLLLAFGVVAGVISARASGRGQVVDAAMLDGATLLATMTYELWNRGAWDARPGHNVNDGGAPFYRTYLTSDQKYVAVGAMETVFWDRLIAGLALDPAALPAQYDRERWPELAGILAAVFVTRTRDEWAAELADACVSPVLTMAEAPSDPHNAARGLFVPGTHGPVPAPAPRFTPR